MTIGKADAAFYCFERVALATILDIKKNEDYIGEDGTKELMQKVSESYGFDSPKFKYTRKDSRFCYHRGGTLHFNYYWGLTVSTVLHELAHFLVYRLNLPGHRHGPEYTRIWIDIFSKYYDVPAEQFEDLADARGLKYAGRKIKPVSKFVPSY